MTKVLVVDDAVFMRLTLKKFLSQNDFEVVGEAVNGIEAVSKYKELKPDLVTMDITMPEMTGVEALKAILEFDPKAKVVMISAMGQENIVKQAIIVGAKSFIVKPFNEDQVVSVLKKLS